MKQANGYPKVNIVDALRGFASLIVFLFHLICVSNGYVKEGLLTRFFYFGKFGVHFFFVISGFVITYSMIVAGYEVKDFFTFLKKRLIRIEPPYLFVVLITTLFLWVRAYSGIAGSNPDMVPGWKQLLLHVGYLIPFSQYGWLSIVFWTLAIEFQFYLGFSFLLPVIRKSIWLRSLMAVVFLTFSYFITADDNFLFWSPVFLLGIYLAFFRLKIVTQKELLSAAFVLGAFIFFKMGTEILVFSIIPSAIIYYDPPLKNRVLDFFGKISYSLYLIHTLIAFTIINLAMRVTTQDWQRPLFLILAFFATLLASFGLYYFVERPFKAMASSIKYRK